MKPRIFKPGHIDPAHDFCPVPGSHTVTSCNYFREQLAKYGQHLAGCTIGGRDCSCGLMQALDARAMAATQVLAAPTAHDPARCPDCGGDAGPPREDR